MSLAESNRARALEQRVAALEAAFLRPPEPNSSEVCERLQKLEGEIRAMKARMGKIKESA